MPLRFVLLVNKQGATRWVARHTHPRDGARGGPGARAAGARFPPGADARRACGGGGRQRSGANETTRMFHGTRGHASDAVVAVDVPTQDCKVLGPRGRRHEDPPGREEGVGIGGARTARTVRVAAAAPSRTGANDGLRRNDGQVVRVMIPKSSDATKATSIFQHAKYQVCYRRYAARRRWTRRRRRRGSGRPQTRRRAASRPDAPGRAAPRSGRRYASLYFVVGFDGDENELALLEWIHCLVETLDSVFSNVCELDILFHHDTVNEIIDDMVYNGQFVECNRQKNLEATLLTNRFQKTSSA